MRNFLCIFSSILLVSSVAGQSGFCNITSVSGQGYFTAECGNLLFQSVVIVSPMPYGECGGLIFSSDITGTESTTSTSDPRKEIEYVSIYPNPVFDILNIEISGNQSVYPVSIFTSTGVLVYYNQYQNTSDKVSIQLSTDHLLPGMYFVRVDSYHKNIRKLKFIKI